MSDDLYVDQAVTEVAYELDNPAKVDQVVIEVAWEELLAEALVDQCIIEIAFVKSGQTRRVYCV